MISKATEHAQLLEPIRYAFVRSRRLPDDILDAIYNGRLTDEIIDEMHKERFPDEITYEMNLLMNGFKHNSYAL